MANTYDVIDYGPREPEYDFDPYAEDGPYDDEDELSYWTFYCGVCDESPCISPEDCRKEHELYVIHMRQTV